MTTKAKEATKETPPAETNTQPPQNELALATKGGIPANVADAYKSQPTGFEHDRATDFVIPFFSILQGLSPQMETVEGAKLGFIINTSSNELFSNGIHMVVCRKIVKYPEWLPNRGGLFAVHEPDSELVKKMLAAVNNDPFTPLVRENGNVVQETKYIYGVLCDDNKRPMGFGTVGFSVTKIKRYNAWNTDARNKLGQFGLPMHALVWHFGSFKDKNSKGEFYNWTHELMGGTVNTALVDPVAHKDLFDAVKSLMGRDDVKVDIAGERSTEGAGDAM